FVLCHNTLFSLLIFILSFFFYYFARFPRGRLQPVVFSLSCSLRSLAKILFNKICIYNEIL
ncbi:hypothetical protein BUZ01_16145, partial [Staphylococcus gallinarum]